MTRTSARNARLRVRLRCPMSDGSASELDLMNRVGGVMRTLHAVVAGCNPLPDALAQYIPTNPPRFMYRDVLDQGDRSRAFVHELGHTSLHPPDTSVNTEINGLDEERAIHEAASRVCDHYGVIGYRELMIAHGVTIEPPLPSDSKLVDSLMARLIEALDDPTRIPASWGTPI
jgi:hypothetical protein